MEVQMSGMMEKYLNVMGREIVKELGKKYEIDQDEAMEFLQLSDLKIEVEATKKPNQKKKSTIPLPFCGKVCNGNCYAIRLNHSLYTQCTNKPDTSVGTKPVCTTCKNQIDKNSNGEPTYGYVTERVEKGDSFSDPKGKSPVNYGNIMEKLNISRNEAEREAANQGLTIPENQFEVKKARRGRPKKDATAIDTSGSDDETPKQEKKRGRPKKDKQVVSANTGDALIKDLVDKVKPVTKPLVEEESDDDSESVEVEKITFKGKEYLKSSDNTIYDPSTWDELGKWDTTKNKIVFEVIDSD